MRQISIIAKNVPGELAEIAAALGAAGVNIEDLDAEAADATGVIHLRVDRYDEALRALGGAGIKAISEDALVIRIEDRPGALAAIAARFGDAQLNLRSLHILKREDGAVLVSLVTSDNAAARTLVADVLAGR